MSIELDFEQFKQYLKPETIAQVQQEWGGLPIYIPKLSRDEREIRDNQIKQKYYTGKCTAHQISIEYKISERTVYRVLNSRIRVKPAVFS